MLGILPLLMSPWVLASLAALGFLVFRGRGGPKMGTIDSVTAVPLENPLAIAGDIVLPGNGSDVNISYFGDRHYTTKVRYKNHGATDATFYGQFRYTIGGQPTFAWETPLISLKGNSTLEQSYRIPLDDVPSSVLGQYIAVELWGRGGTGSNPDGWFIAGNHFQLT